MYISIYICIIYTCHTYDYTYILHLDFVSYCITWVWWDTTNYLIYMYIEIHTHGTWVYIYIYIHAPKRLRANSSSNHIAANWCSIFTYYIVTGHGDSYVENWDTVQYTVKNTIWWADRGLGRPIRQGLMIGLFKCWHFANEAVKTTYIHTRSYTYNMYILCIYIYVLCNCAAVMYVL